MPNNHFDIKKAPVLENQERLTELRINQLLSDIAAIKEGMTCIDLGCGTGVFSFPLVDHVGEKGHIYAVDESNEMLDYIRKKKPLKNMLLINRDASDTGLKSNIADICLLAFILHEVSNSYSLIKEAFRLLKPNGNLLVVEWKAELDSKGPPSHVRIPQDQLMQLFNQAGFAGFRYIDWSVNHYIAIGAKKIADN